MTENNLQIDLSGDSQDLVVGGPIKATTLLGAFTIKGRLNPATMGAFKPSHFE